MLVFTAYPSDNTTSTGGSTFIAGGATGSVIGGVAGGLFMLIVAVIVFVVLLLYRRMSMTGTYICSMYNCTSITSINYITVATSCYHYTATYLGYRLLLIVQVPQMYHHWHPIQGTHMQ